MTRDELINEIEQAADRHDLAPATVTSRAVGNSRLYRRLKDGKSCTLDVAGRIANFIAALDGAAHTSKPTAEPRDAAHDFTPPNQEDAA